MSDSNLSSSSNDEGVIQKTLREITQPFKDLLKASRALWGINLSYLLEGITYFGIVGYLVIYFNNYVKLDDISAGQMVGIQTAGITLAMLFLGATVDWIGVRKALLYALGFMLIGRLFLTLGTKYHFKCRTLVICSFNCNGWNIRNHSRLRNLSARMLRCS